MKYINNIFYVAIASSVLVSCKDDDVPVPATYDATAFSSNTTVQFGVVSRVAKMTGEAKKGRVNGVIVSADSLNYWFTTGSPTVKSVSTPYFVGLLEGTNGYIAEIAKASGNAYTPTAPVAGSEGGVFEGYLFDENGLEFEQLIDKGQFGAVHYKHAVDLLSGTYTAATPDQVMVLLGMSPTFPSSNNATKHAQPDKYMAIYAARRDKNDGNGFYTTLKNNFLKLQIAIKAGDRDKVGQQEAAEAIKLTWEKVNAATVINYCHVITSTMSSTNISNKQKADALHAYSECIGFIAGWRTIPQTHKKITDTQIDEVLTLLNAAPNTTPTAYKIITNPIAEISKLEDVINKLKTIYGFSSTEIEDFKKNWVSEQVR